MGYRFRLRKPMHVQGRWAFEENLVLLGAGSTRLFGYINWIENVSCCNLSWKMIMTLPIRVNDQTHTKPPRRWRSTLQSDEYPLFDTVWPLLPPLKNPSYTPGLRRPMPHRSEWFLISVDRDVISDIQWPCSHVWEDHTVLWRNERNQKS